MPRFHILHESCSIIDVLLLLLFLDGIAPKPLINFLSRVD
jgi:hypothetical protein